MRTVFRLFTFWINIAAVYNRLKSDEKRRAESVRLGVRSIVQTIICCALALLSVYGFSACLGGISSAPVLSLLGAILCAAAAVVLIIQGLIGGLLCMIYQFRLNGRAVRWAALAVWLVSAAAVIVGAALIFI